MKKKGSVTKWIDKLNLKQKQKKMLREVLLLMEKGEIEQAGLKVGLDWKRRADIGLWAYFTILHSYDGEKCRTCGAVQGVSKKGFNRYYCNHYDARVKRRMKKYNGILIKIMMDDMLSKFGREK